jgi:hypothetical protein
MQRARRGDTAINGHNTFLIELPCPDENSRCRSTVGRPRGCNWGRPGGRLDRRLFANVIGRRVRWRLWVRGSRARGFRGGLLRGGAGSTGSELETGAAVGDAGVSDAGAAATRGREGVAEGGVAAAVGAAEDRGRGGAGGVSSAGSGLSEGAERTGLGASTTTVAGAD